MDFKLSKEQISCLEQKYEREIKTMEKEDWYVSINCCGCSGDCGSKWMQS